ncbi:porin [Paraburkholderia sp. CNPSo 3076]|uniref:porin n=1 Tax=Paraburkholderia sp. CNPSo 3076 TaxID=2940936 RepID=UPI002251486B|nr:porin [Paraburkholderia sp. CNPSo 3076]MCX5542105.1 porin [Paraburkholderia sp. CNPSo 3076]
MKTRWISTVFLASAGFAHAQSSITLYGIVDTGVEYYNNSATKGSFVGMPTLTGEVPSRWGLRGSEDLGGGYKAVFVLENGFALPNGTSGYGGRLFGRQANVGLSFPLGSLTIGRQMNMSMYALFDADVIGPSIHSLSSFDTYLPNARSDNAVGYLGSFGGFKLGATYSFGRDAAGPVGPSATNCPGQVPGNSLACRQYTMLVAYSGSRFGVAASYDVMRGGNGAIAPLSSPADTDTHVILDGYVNYGNGKLGAGWIRRNTSSSVHAQSDLFFLGGNYYFTPIFSTDAQVVRYILRSHSDSTLLIGRVNYFLSKTTTVYSSIGYMINSDLGNAPVAAGGTVVTGKNQVGVMVGIQHRF